MLHEIFDAKNVVQIVEVQSPAVCGGHLLVEVLFIFPQTLFIFPNTLSLLFTATILVWPLFETDLVLPFLHKRTNILI